MGLQRVRHDWVTDLNWTVIILVPVTCRHEQASLSPNSNVRAAVAVGGQESERPSNGQVYPEPNNLGHRAGSYLLTYFHGSGPVICKYFPPICGFFSYSLDAMDFLKCETWKLKIKKWILFYLFLIFFCYLFVCWFCFVSLLWAIEPQRRCFKEERGSGWYARGTAKEKTPWVIFQNVYQWPRYYINNAVWSNLP